MSEITLSELKRVRAELQEYINQHNLRMQTDPEYRKQHEALVKLSRIHQELNWPDEPMEKNK